MKIPLDLSPVAPVTVSPGKDGAVYAIPAEGGEIRINKLPDLKNSRYLVLDITTLADMQHPFEIHFIKPGEDKGCMIMTTSSIPGVRAVMPFDFEWLDNTQVFRPRTPGRLKTTVFGVAMETTDVGSISINVRKSDMEAKIVVHNAYLSDKMPDTTLVSPFPVVDEFGQVAGREWPGKTKSYDEMAGRLKAIYEKALAAKNDGMPFPERFGYTKWGGDSGRKLTDGTGFFALHNADDIWYLTDPDGYAFFSVGPDCVGTNTSSVLTGIEKLYAMLPDRAEYAGAYNKTEGNFGGAPSEFIDFYRVNMIRVFGSKWKDAYSLISEYLMKEMGFNTIANWSDNEIIAGTTMPYVIPLRDFPTTKQIIFRDFPDVFSKEYEKNSVDFAGQMKEYAKDPRLIGYFMRNEPQWGFSEDINLAREMFRNPIKFESKRALWDFLIEKYGTAAELSRVWNMKFEGINCLIALKLSDLPEAGTCEDDLRAFSQKMVERYVSTPAKALRTVDPNHLNMGMRYAFLSTDTMFMGSEHIDVFSINCYRDKPRESDVKNILERCGKPCIIGEYHHGSNDRGCFGNALRGAANAEERGVAYQYYTEQAAAMPSMLGCHYFCLGDEAALGRYDGEAWVIGFIDVCHKPYEEMQAAAIRTHERLYGVKSGKMAPHNTPAVEAPTNSY